jgi:ABC-type dipeptide/oligopeptide/nickel transport system permease subunit
VSVETAPVPVSGRPAGTRVGRLVRGAARNLAFVAIGLLVVIAVAWPLIAPYDPIETGVGPPLAAPSSEHLFGTDQSGRDVFSRVLAGTRVSFLIGVASAGLAVILGGVLGVIAAMAPRGPSEVLMRVLDVMLAFPAILLAVVLAASLGSGTLTTLVVLAVVYTPVLARFVRANVLAQLNEDYVAAARLIETPRLRLVGYHIGANIAVPVLVFAAAIAAEAIIVEAALSFIGVGIAPPTPSWGNIISEGAGFVSTGEWWIGGFGGLAVFVAALSLNAASNNLNRRLDAGVERR